MIQRISILVALFTVFAPLGLAQFKTTPVEVEVQVVDDRGNPLTSIEVKISYLTLLDSERAVRESKLSDEEGRVRFRGKGYKRVSVYIEQSGYYGYRDYHTIEDLIESSEIRAVLKEVRHPIVMLADGDIRMTIPAFDEEIGYDFVLNDWVAPHGRGERSDVTFQVVGEYRSMRDRWSVLTLRFPNEGDGLIPFESDFQNGSILESGHEAPVSGYEGKREWRKELVPTTPYNHKETVDWSENLSYYLRVRTELDEDGNVVSAHYGKIYGDFRFDGVWPRPSGIVARAYYVNPTPNDRNVEARTGETLIEGLDGIDLPKLP